MEMFNPIDFQNYFNLNYLLLSENSKIGHDVFVYWTPWSNIKWHKMPPTLPIEPPQHQASSRYTQYDNNIHTSAGYNTYSKMKCRK